MVVSYKPAQLFQFKNGAIFLCVLNRCIVKLNPKKGNKRPNKTASEIAGGCFSSKQTHAALQKLSSEYQDFFAEREEETESESENASSPSENE